MIAVGLDLGNGLLKLAGPRPGDRLLVPHALAPAEGLHRDVYMLAPGEDPAQHLHAEIRAPFLDGPRQIFAGELALREYPDRVLEVEAGERKSGSDRVLLLALTALAAAVHHADRLATMARLSLAVALPMAEAADPAARQTLASRLRGRHTVRWLSTPQWDGRTLDLVVDVVDVIPEGAAAFLALAASDPSLMDETVAVIDVGVRSVDWAIFREGRFQAGPSGGAADGGLATAADRILAAARQRHGPHVARHRGDVLNALHEAARSAGPVVLWGLGRPHNLTDVARHELQRLARDVTRLVTEAVSRAGNITRLLLIGGGGLLLAPYLQDVSRLPMTLADDPLWANAAGLWHRAWSRAEAVVT